MTHPGHWGALGEKETLVAYKRHLYGELPERDGKGVGLRPLPDQEGSVSRNPHQHVLSMAPGQVGVVPPGAAGRKQSTHCTAFMYQRLKG